MRIEEVKVEGGWLMLRPADIADAIKLRMSFKPGNYEFVTVKKKRSLDANAYAWVLMSKIGIKLNKAPEDVYRDEIRDIAGKTELLYCRSEAVEAFKSEWLRNHLGRYADVLSDDGDFACIQVTYGSSDYDVHQMAELIDHIIQDCHELGIEVMPEEELESLLRSWDGRKRI